MFTGSRKYQKRAKKIQNILGSEVFKGIPSKQIEWEYDASERMIEGFYIDIVTGASFSSSATLDRKGNAIEYDISSLADTDSNGTIDTGYNYIIEVNGTKGLKNHLKNLNKSKNRDKFLSLHRQAYSDNGRGLANYLDSLPGVDYPSYKGSTAIMMTIKSSNLPMIFV